MNIKTILKNNKLFNLIRGIPLSKGEKAFYGLGAFVLGGNVLRSVHSNICNFNKFESMHSGKETSMSAYSNFAMTDFGSGWQGISDKILKLTKNKNAGLSATIKETMTAFGNSGVDLGKTMMKISRKKNKHRILNIKDIIYNPVLDLHNNRIGHIEMR